METEEAGALESPRHPEAQGTQLAGFEYPIDEAHEACISCWAQGWHARDAEVAELHARLERAEGDADKFYRIAFDRPGDLDRRLDEAAEEYWAEFISEESHE
ncbi:hypothetical protein [Agromyces sp. NPDC055658]